MGSCAARALLAAALLVACAGATPPEPAASTPAPPAPADERSGASGIDTLVGLAEEALARGDFSNAARRFHRVLVVAPNEPRALTGLGRVALAVDDRPAARRWFESALASAPASLDALIGLAALDTREGAREAARRSLELAVAADAGHALAHARLAELTGRAPAAALAAAASAEAARELAAVHPYDPRALLRAAELLLQEGRDDAALSLLERTVWLADLHPASAVAALQLLPEIDEGWSGRRAISVHLYADEPIRAQEGWRFGQRTLWLQTSVRLEPVLGVRFVPMSIGAFRTRDLPAQLDPIFAALRRTASPQPARGIIAGVTGREPPRAPGRWKQGLAEFLGRSLVARVRPGQRSSRVLTHELLHLFGGVHVSERVASIMNPTGRSAKLDAANAAIARATRTRGFTRRGFAADVVARVDLDETIDAYLGALKVNLELRKLGIAEAIQAGRQSRYQKRRAARKATRLDPHLGDVSRMLARLMLADGQSVEALFLFETAVGLYGRRSPRGEATFEESEVLRRALVERHAE